MTHRASPAQREWKPESEASAKGSAPASNNRLRHLLDKQRHAVGALDNLVDGLA